MNVLIVHDRREIGQEIRSIVEAICSKAQVVLVEDASSARRQLGDGYFDLLILDLTIPVVAGRGSNGFQVAEGLLEELVAAPNLMTPGNMVGITLDETALDVIQNNIGPHLMAIVAEDADGRWRKQIGDRIRYVLHSSAARSQAMLTKYDLDLLIITALDKELAPYRNSFALNDYPGIPGLSEFTFVDKDGRGRRGACYAIGRAGQPSAASETQGLLCQLRPRLAIMTGFCGGVPGKADLGDILFAESAIDWDYGKWKPTETAARLYARPEPVVIRNSRTHRIARRLVDEGLPDPDPLIAGMLALSDKEISAAELKLAPFASGSAVIGDQDVLDSIMSLNDNVGGVDMESFGFYFACEHAHAASPHFLCIKAVADECGPEKDDRLHAACSFGSAHVATVIATHLWDFEQ